MIRALALWALLPLTAQAQTNAPPVHNPRLPRPRIHIIDDNAIGANLFQRLKRAFFKEIGRI